VIWFHACCFKPAGSLAWASDQVGPIGFSPYLTSWFGPNQKTK
jgi:hypothetical protein